MRRRTKQMALASIAAILLFAAFLGLQLHFDNFHEVIPNELYRSAQLDAEDIKHHVEKKAIRSILNLRGAHEGQVWYDEEVAETERLGISHIDFKMSATEELSTEQALALIEVMRKAPKPMLIHCRSGADRTGLAAAFYVAAVAKLGEESAERQLWIHYGHLPFYFNGSYAMDRTFERLEPVLGFKDS
jgi:protein tyrosine/serine phosphatase